MGLTFDDIESAMSQLVWSVYWETTSQNLGSNEDCNSELRLSMQFNGTCHKCDQEGHKKADCPKKKGRIRVGNNKKGQQDEI